MRFALLCSGSKGNSFYIENDGTKVLIDCGGTKKYLSGALEKLHVSVDDLDGLVITHDHSDHISQIRYFRDIPVYSPVSLPDLETFEVRPKQKFTIGSLIFTPVPLSHDAYHTTGYIIENGQEKLVYITDTGYLPSRYQSLLQGADYNVMECNHDVGMLMRTSRPQYLKQRICSDEGHLNNEDCAEALAHYIDQNTKLVVLAHISQQANTRQKALESVVKRLQEEKDRCRRDLLICAAGQFEMILKGEDNEKMDPGTVCCPVHLECRTDDHACF